MLPPALGLFLKITNLEKSPLGFSTKNPTPTRHFAKATRTHFRYIKCNQQSAIEAQWPYFFRLFSCSKRRAPFGKFRKIKIN
jgi:hypothetical protein